MGIPLYILKMETMQTNQKDHFFRYVILLFLPLVAILLLSTSAPLSAQTEKEQPFLAYIYDAAERHSVDPALIMAIIKAESGYNPRAVSRVGARGLMQLMPATARELGVSDSFNPEHNIHGGVKYFKFLLNKFDGRVRLALAAYNAGIRRVQKYGGVPPYKATRHYIRKVMLYYQHYQQIIGAEAEPA